MANKRIDKNCVEVRVCVDEEMNKEIEKEQARMVLEGLKPALKPEAAYRYFRNLMRRK